METVFGNGGLLIGHMRVMTSGMSLPVANLQKGPPTGALQWGAPRKDASRSPGRASPRGPSTQRATTRIRPVGPDPSVRHRAVRRPSGLLVGLRGQPQVGLDRLIPLGEPLLGLLVGHGR